MVSQDEYRLDLDVMIAQQRIRDRVNQFQRENKLPVTPFPKVPLGGVEYEPPSEL